MSLFSYSRGAAAAALTHADGMGRVSPLAGDRECATVGLTINAHQETQCTQAVRHQRITQQRDTRESHSGETPENHTAVRHQRITRQ